ncbi:MAG: porin [Planctomycetes bacterium]|nr:porin [Planctomycetota bacterium]
MEARLSASIVGVTLAFLCATATGQQLASFEEGKAVEGNASCQECDDCENECADCGPWRLFPEQYAGFDIYGWLDAGFVGNTGSPSSKFNGPYNAVDRSNELMLNQMYLVAERKLGCNGCFGIGGRLDVIYGEDFFLAQSVGLETTDNGALQWNPEYYGLAIPQAYIEVGRTDLSLKVGHFYSIIGYEGLPAVGNFFYSKAYSYQFAGPFTHWGGLATWKPCDAWEFQTGLTNQWDTLDRAPSDNLNVLAKAKFTGESGWWTSLGVVTGKDINNPGNLPIPTEFTNRTRYSWLVSLPVNCKTEYVFHQWLGSQDQGAPDGGTAYWYGIDQYLYRTLNDCWKAGVRFEWFRDEEGTRVGLNRPSNPNKVPFVGNFYSLAAGLNWTPTTNLTIRPEIRADWFDGNQAVQPYDDGADSTQLMLGVDGILTF